MRVQFYQNHKLFIIFVAIVIFLILFVVFEAAFIKFNGQTVPAPEIPRQKQHFGKGPPLTYAVLGDSTAVGQGGDYPQGIAVKTAEHLAKDHAVTLQNFAVSGARMADVSEHQAAKAAKLKPDIVLISAGANDVTHLTGIDKVKKDLTRVIKKIEESNSKVEIIVTGSPQMGSIPRFPQPVRYIAKVRTDNMNQMFIEVSREENINFAPIAEKTGPIFAKNPKLFAKDNFHPNNDGYAVWLPVLFKALDGLNKED